MNGYIHFAHFTCSINTHEQRLKPVRLQILQFEASGTKWGIFARMWGNFPQLVPHSTLLVKSSRWSRHWKKCIFFEFCFMPVRFINIYGLFSPCEQLAGQYGQLVASTNQLLQKTASGFEVWEWLWIIPGNLVNMPTEWQSGRQLKWVLVIFAHDWKDSDPWLWITVYTADSQENQGITCLQRNCSLHQDSGNYRWH